MSLQSTTILFLFFFLAAILASVNALPLYAPLQDNGNRIQAVAADDDLSILQRRRLIYSHHAETHFSSAFETTYYKKYSKSSSYAASASFSTIVPITKTEPIIIASRTKAAYENILVETTTSVMEEMSEIAPFVTYIEPPSYHETTTTTTLKVPHYTYHFTTGWSTQFSTDYTTVYVKKPATQIESIATADTITFTATTLDSVPTTVTPIINDSNFVVDNHIDSSESTRIMSEQKKVLVPENGSNNGIVKASKEDSKWNTDAILKSLLEIENNAVKERKKFTQKKENLILYKMNKEKSKLSLLTMRK